MKLAVAYVVVVVCALAVAAGGVGIEGSKRATKARAIVPSVPSGKSDTQAAPPAEAGTDFDIGMSLEDDDVTSALARYLIDENGELYELHAPRAEIKRLGAPES
ncbi:MAG: hypothetical protein ACE148_14050 [Vicinamibacterales bacterium]